MNKTFSVKNNDLHLSLRADTLDYSVVYNGTLWKSHGRKAYFSFYRKTDGKYSTIKKSFSSAKNISHTIDNDTIVSTFSGFSVAGQNLDVVVTTKAKLTENGVEFRLSASGENDNYLDGVCWPRALDNTACGGYSVHSIRQGTLLFDGFKHLIDKISANSYRKDVNAGDCYVPLWGRVTAKGGYSAYVEEAFDCGLYNSFGPRASSLTTPFFYSSLGKLGYERVVRLTFFANGDYNDVAKVYRSFLIKTKQLVTIKDKIALNPNINGLIGTPIIHTNIFETVQPESQFYNKFNAETLYSTFDGRAKEFEKYRAMGLKKAYIHLDGWGKAGYDNLHPYVMPPCEKAGGAKGMKNLADTCEKIGYLFGIHDQYRDFYTRCELYDEKKAVTGIDGERYTCSIWLGGKHNWLCSSFALDFVKRTYTELEKLGIKLKGTYLDVFSIVPGDECFDPSHRVTRAESIAYRKQCFDYLRDNGLIVCSEEPGALMINALDLVHHAPYKVVPQEKGSRFGTPVPILNLIYHDCVFVPWQIDGVGGWGIPNGEAGKLHCALNAQSPYFVGTDDTDKSTPRKLLCDEILKYRIDTAKELCAINEKLYDKEMLKHEFLSHDKKLQRTTYSDGTTITVDFGKNSYEVNWSK